MSQTTPLTCAECGKAMQRKPGSRPQGQATCLACRRLAPKGAEYITPSRRDECTSCGKAVMRTHTSAAEIVCRECRTPPMHNWMKRRPPAMMTKTCDMCGLEYETRRADQRYCSTECRGKRRNWGGSRPPAAVRGYGAEHRRIRKEWEPIVAAGEATCCICGEWIEPGTPWHLDHTEDRTGYRGAAHSTCNVLDGAKRGAKRATEKRDLKPWMERDNHPCPVCGTEVTWASQRCCSRACASTFARDIRQPRPRPEPQAKTCALCGAHFTGRRRLYCSESCLLEMGARQARDSYRQSAGLPVDPSRPTKPRRRLAL